MIAAIRGGLSAQAASKGAGLRILTETVASPTLAAQIQQVLAQQPEREVDSVGAGQSRQRARGRAHRVRPVRRAALRPDQGRRHPLARRRLPRRRTARTTCITCGSSRRAAASKRAPTISIASTSSNRITRVTGGRADNRLPLKSSQIEAFARAVAAGAGVSGVTRHGAGRHRRRSPPPSRRISPITSGRAVVMAGDSQPPAVHALAHAINAGDRRAGDATCRRRRSCRRNRTPRSASWSPTSTPAACRCSSSSANRTRCSARRPTSSSPRRCARSACVVHSGLFFDETATLSHWHIPAAHFLEAWSDARTIDGTVSIVQPLIQPLYGGKSAHEVIATMSERPERAGYDVVREYWQANLQGHGVRQVRRVQRVPECRSAPPAAPDAPAAPAAPQHLPRLAICSRSSGESGCTTASSTARRRRGDDRDGRA